MNLQQQRSSCKPTAHIKENSVKICSRNNLHNPLGWSHDLAWIRLQAMFVKTEAALINTRMERLREPPAHGVVKNRHEVIVYFVFFLN